jgi:hypothetical protein
MMRFILYGLIILAFVNAVLGSIMFWHWVDEPITAKTCVLKMGQLCVFGRTEPCKNPNGDGV